MALKWKPSKNPNAVGYVSRSFEHPSTGDRVISHERFINKWSKRLSTWLGEEVKLPETLNPWERNYCMDFDFVSEKGTKYRVYQAGEGPHSSEYHVQKLK